MNTGASTIICNFSPEYEQLTQHLPPQEKKALDQYKINKDSLDSYQKLFLDLTKHSFWNLGIEKVSRLSLVMLKESMLSIQQVSSLHMCMEAIDRFIIKHKMYLGFFNLPNNYSTSSFSRIPCDFKLDLIKDKKNVQAQICSQYVQKFFGLNQIEWQKFCNLMQNEDSTEHLGYLFTFPKFGYEFLDHKTFSDRTNRERTIFIPSFSMLQHGYAIKNESTHELQQLIPFFGECFAQDVGRLDSDKKTPFNLYYPFPFSIEKKLTPVSQNKQSIEPILLEFLKGQLFHSRYSLNSFDSFRSILNDTQTKINTEYDEVIEDLKVNEMKCDQDNYKVKISNCRIGTLYCFSAVIINCTIKKIVSLNSLYIQDSSVNSIEAANDVFIRKCKKTSIKAERIIFEMNTVSGKKQADTIIALSPKEYIDETCEYDVESDVECKTFIPSFNTDTLHLSKGSRIDKIAFMEDNVINEVLIEEGYTFKGKVEKGRIASYTSLVPSLANSDDSFILTHIA